ncbi:MAG: ribosome recycling factor [Candidatus Bipolaricaulis sp.]|nr:ribosome recycling factor [Candidatus Bipolaricaulis sp.]
MPEQVQREMAEHMKRTLDVLKEHLAKVQTGRANPAMVDDVMVDYYGTRMPLKQLATISAPDANLLVVQPYDKTQIAAVEKAILASDLGLNPASDGNVVRIKVPKLSEERRRELTKVIKARGEETKVALRNVRREANERLDAMKKDGTVSEDAHRRYRDKTDEAVREASQTVDTLIEQKSKQIQTI